MISLHRFAQGSEQWHAGREDKYTGSNAYKLLTPLGRSEYAKAKRTGFTGNFWTKRGHLLEDEAVELLETIKRVEIDRSVAFVSNTKYPDCIFSPDGLIIGIKRIIEVKSFSEAEHMKLVRGEIDIKIMAQIQYGLTITEYTDAWLVAYHPKISNVLHRLVIIHIKPNRNTIRNFKTIIGTPRRVAA